MSSKRQDDIHAYVHIVISVAEVTNLFPFQMVMNPVYEYQNMCRQLPIVLTLFSCRQYEMVANYADCDCYYSLGNGSDTLDCYRSSSGQPSK